MAPQKKASAVQEASYDIYTILGLFSSQIWCTAGMLFVNFDREILQLIREAKFLQRMGEDGV
jgi:hypothetical protein